MKAVFEYLYFCFYSAMFSKHFKNQRAAMAISVTITLLFLAMLFALILFFQLYRILPPFGLALLVILFGFLVSYGSDNVFEKREFYSKAIEKYKSNSLAFKRVSALIAAFIFVGSLILLIATFFLFRID